MHGLHMIHGSHSHTFYLIDTCIFNILQDISNDKLYECIFLNSNLLIAFEKITQNNLIKINVINAFYLKPKQFKDRIILDYLKQLQQALINCLFMFWLLKEYPKLVEQSFCTKWLIV